MAQAAWRGGLAPYPLPSAHPSRQGQLRSLKAVNRIETRHGVRRQLECLLKNVISFYFPYSALPPPDHNLQSLLPSSCVAGGDLGAQTLVCSSESQQRRPSHLGYLSVLRARSQCGRRRWQAVVWQETAPSKVTHHLQLPSTRVWKPRMGPLRLETKGKGLLQPTLGDNGG